MRRWLIVLCALLAGCGTLTFTPNGHRVFYKSKDGEFSCYTTKCCWPYKEKVMLCTEPTGLNGGTIYLEYVPDK